MQDDHEGREGGAHVVADLAWYRAATLPERLDWGSPSEVDVARGEKRLAMWTELAGLEGPSETLDERLRPLGLCAEELVALLGETDRSLAGRAGSEPDWHRTFARWWQAGLVTPPHERFITQELGLLEWCRPLMEGAVWHLSAALHQRLERVRQEPVLGDVHHVLEVVCATLPASDVLEFTRRTLVLELNVARVEGRLEGDTTEDRYRSFMRMLAEPAIAWDLWEEYVVLARLITDQLVHWTEACLEFIDALTADLPVLRRQLFPDREPNVLRRIDFGVGDRHRRGRSVGIVTFDTGRAVYKPRSLAMDVAFDAVLAWANAQPLDHQLRRAQVIDRGDHGWAEYVDAGQRTDAAGGDRYSWRLGALTGLLYLLHATDFHHENILANGEHPVLVDLEALLHTDKTAAVVKIEGFDDIAASTLSHSVHSVGVLPNTWLIRDEEGTFGLDVSALAGEGGQLTPMPVPFWEDQETDVMRLVDRRVEMDGVDNHPLDEDGVPLRLIERVDEFVAGFDQIYDRLVEHQQHLLDPAGPLNRFATTQSRYIARPTHIYARMLLESTHPDFLRDGLDRDRSLARLCTGHAGIDCSDQMVRAEIAELRGGDVPVFTIDARTGVLRAGVDSRPIGRRNPPLEALAERVGLLGHDDKAFQKWVIRSAVAATAMGAGDARWPNWRRPLTPGDRPPGDFLAEAQRVAQRLCDLALEDDHSVGWIGMGLVDETFWQLAPAPIDMFIGTSGIAHALDTVAAVTGDRRIASTAHTVLEQVARRAELMAQAGDEATLGQGGVEVGIGAFSLLGSVVYALAHAAARHQRDRYADAACSLLPTIDALARQDSQLDLVSGAAGAALALLSLESVRPGCGALDVAVRCADHLVTTQRPAARGGGWVSPINSEAPLAGMSHGASGIAVALARVHAHHPLDRYVQAIRAAVTYERHTFDAVLGNWRDLRPISAGGRSSLIAWCHGAAGIALARDILMRHPVGAELPDWLESDRSNGVRATFGTGLHADPVSGIGNHSLCHGDIGNLLILERARDAAREPDVAAALPRVWGTLLDEGQANGWLCGVPNGLETPGLMTGLAGIAWGLARHAEPDDVPDVLALDPPRPLDCPTADDRRTP